MTRHSATLAFTTTRASPRASLLLHSLAQYLARRQAFCFVLLVSCLVVFTCWLPVWDAGDAHEYIHMQQSWWAHGSPDLRFSDVTQGAANIKAFKLNSNVDPFLGYYPTRNGARYCWHFWFYPLLTLPARFVLHALHTNEYLSFFWTNLTCVLVACYGALFHSGLSRAKRWMLVGLSVISPVLWLVCWIHTEAVTWSCVLMSVTFLSKRRYALGALCASLGALQNPPLLALGLYSLALVSYEAWSARYGTGRTGGENGRVRTLASAQNGAAERFACWRNRRAVLSTLAAVMVGVIPAVFYQWTFGTSSLIVREGSSSPRFFSWERVWSLLFDLNQGMLPFVPIAVMLGLAALVIALCQQRWRLVGLGMTLLIVIMGACTTNNWNSGTAGMMRYAIWVLPLLAWLIVETLPDTWRTRTVVTAGVAFQAALVLTFNAGVDHLRVQGPAVAVWSYAPALYSPDPEIFLHRALGRGHLDAHEFPVGYVAPSGHVVKILTDADGLRHMGRRFYGVSPSWLRQVQTAYKDQTGWFYLQPPSDAIQGVRDQYSGQRVPLQP